MTNETPSKDDKPKGTTLEPTSAASTAAAKPPADFTPSSDKTAASKTAAPQPAAAKPPATTPSRGMGLFGTLLVAVIASALVAAVLVALAPRWTPLLGLAQPAAAPPAPAPAPPPDPRIAQLGERLDQLAARPVVDPAQAEATRTQLARLQEEIARLAKEQDATADALAQVADGIDDVKPQAGAADEAVLERLAKMEQQLAATAATLERLGAMRAELDTAVGQLARLGQIETRMSAAEKEAAERRGIDAKATEAARASAIVSLGTRLRQALAQGQDGAADLASLQSLAGQDEELRVAIEALTPLAGKKTATLVELRQRFPAMAREIIAADAGDQAASWWEKALARLQNLVSVRRTGPDVTGEDAEARVAQAEAALQAGRLDQAVAALKPLTGQAAKAAAPWIAEAETALAAQAAAERIVTRGTALLGQAGGTTPATR